ncbi:MAG: BolA/IbaG family iron-sulfur metabolism protein [Polyangiaceae bacterium]|jgi:acid stress-induced BolA-like protein IbaG/YrbA|nr:BolA/IbaG family iron-sulfur metabolism protein [Polyangiaceae bacterium]MBK8939685.1 BolA/IbaG family iron-sulfur metabolism protein [Polyangiaceae bacterium]
MSHHPTSFEGDIFAAVRDAIRAKIPDAEVAVEGAGGHFSIEVVSPVFSGKNRLESQRLVLGSIKHLMSGDLAPVHAVDSLKTRAP